MNHSAIVLLAHGSLDPRWKEPFEKILFRLEKELGKNNIKLAYMDFIKPDFESVVKELFDENIKEIKLLPLFMSGGGHVDKDIPKIVSALKDKLNGIKIKILPAIGEYPEVSSAMIEVIKNELSIRV